MLNKERFFRFGLDLRLREVDPPKDMANWTDRPFRTPSGRRKGFVEENLETVLSDTMHLLLPEEEWFVIGRQESAFPDADITALGKAGDLIFFEAKKGEAQTPILEQGLSYALLAQNAGFTHYTSRFLRMQLHRDYREAIRLLGLVKGRTLDLSGPNRERSWARLQKLNVDTQVDDDEFLSWGRLILRDGGYRPIDGPLVDAESALIETFDRRFGFESRDVLHSRLGKAATLGLVAEGFSEEVLKRWQDHAQHDGFFYLLRLKLYRHTTEPCAFLLGFTHVVPDGVISNKDSTSYEEAFEIRRFLRFLKEEIIRLEALDRQRGYRTVRIPVFKWRWFSKPYRELHFYPTGVGHGGRIHWGPEEHHARWALDWMRTGTRPLIRARIVRKLSESTNGMPMGVKTMGSNGNLVKRLQVPSDLDRSAAGDLAEEIYAFLTFTFALYDSCGLWNDPYDDYAAPS